MQPTGSVGPRLIAAFIPMGAGRSRPMAQTSRRGSRSAVAPEMEGADMARKVLAAAGVILALVAVYMLVWPVPVDPVAWQAPGAPGYGGPFTRNERLKAMETLPIGDNHGPETV